MVRAEPPIAAWGPFTGDRDWMLVREARAVAWALNRCRVEGKGGVLRVPCHSAQHTSGANEAVRRFAAVATVVTDERGTWGMGPTYVPWGQARQIGDGMATAKGSSLVVTEHPAMPLVGWAMQMRALDISTGAVTEDTRSPEQLKLIGQAVELACQGWRYIPGDRVARCVMPELAESGLSWAVFVGSVLALDPGRAQVREILHVAPELWRAEHAETTRRLTHPG